VFSATPHADESFIGYLIRLTEINYYETSSWILQLANLGNYLRKVSLAFDESLNLETLSQLTGIGEQELSALRYTPSGVKRNKFVDHDVFGSPVPRIAIRAHRPKVCCACLIQSGYVRKIWDLTGVTTCPLHRCVLLDECPNCERLLPISRNDVGICLCDYDWRDSPLVAVDETQLDVAKRVHSLCGLPLGDSRTKHLQSNPLNKLGLKDLFSALFFIASQYGRSALYSKGKRANIAKFGSSLKNAEVHDLLCKAVAVFDNWPANYFAFLDWRKEESNPAQQARGLSKDFRDYKYSLYRYLRARAFDFLREGFEEYLATHWDGGYTSHVARLRRKAAPLKRFASKHETRGLLKVSSEKVDALLRAGKLRGIISPRGKSRIMLIETSSIHELKHDRDGILNQQQASKILGINPKQTRTLIECCLLKTYSPLDSRGSAGCSTAEIECLLTRLKTTVSKCKCATEKRLGFTRATVSLGIRGIGFGEFINDVLEGKIQPCRMDRRLGMRGLCFCRSDMDNYAKACTQKRFPGYTTIAGAAKLLKTNANEISFLIRKKFLAVHRRLLGGRSTQMISRKTLLAFSSKYVFGSALASELRTAPGYVLEALRSKGVDPISGGSIDGGDRYLYLRKSITNVDLPALLEAKKRATQLAYERPTQFSLDYATQYLNVHADTIIRLCSNGFLKSCKANEYWFTRKQLRKVRGRVRRYAGLVTLEVAARLVGRTPTNFMTRYVHSSVLAPIQITDNGRRFFRRKDLEKLIKSQKRFLNSSEVRKILEIGPTQLFRLAANGILKPISGPLIDGSTFNVFKRNDVGRLHEERQRFKRERLEMGGSNRFGSPAAPRSHPVLSRIEPRVKQLLAEATVKGTRLSGLTIHRQLLKEGYEAHFNTVYRCLHL
jgi:hypothetical protein